MLVINVTIITTIIQLIYNRLCSKCLCTFYKMFCHRFGHSSSVGHGAGLLLNSVVFLLPLCLAAKSVMHCWHLALGGCHIAAVAELAFLRNGCGGGVGNNHGGMKIRRPSPGPLHEKICFCGRLWEHKPATWKWTDWTADEGVELKGHPEAQSSR